MIQDDRRGNQMIDARNRMEEPNGSGVFPDWAWGGFRVTMGNGWMNYILGKSEGKGRIQPWEK